MQSRFVAVGAAIAGAFSISAIGAAAEKAIETGSRIQDMAERVGISAEAVQKLEFAATQAGASFDPIATSIRVMSDRLTDGKLPAALQAMGLSIQQLRAMTPDQAFIAIGDAIAKIPDPMLQSATAVDIFGRGAQAMLPMIKAGMVEIGNQAPIMSNQLVASLDTAGDSWAKMQTQIANLKAQAFGPLLEAFFSLPQSLQVAGAGIATFLPSLEGLAIAIIALGGPGKAFALLKDAAVGFAGFFSMTGGFGVGLTAVAGFFTTTLPAAFASVIAFLGPQGLIALAVIALGLIWYKWGDDITAVVKNIYTAIKTWLVDTWSAITPSISAALTAIGTFFLDVKNKAVAYTQQLFEGVKLWLVDKFNAVVNAIKEKAGMVTGFFKNMYMTIVGGSIVPDMVTGIGQWFGRLTGLMVTPAEDATSSVQTLFQSMADAISGSLDGLIQKIPVVGGALSQLFRDMGGLKGILGKIPGLGGLFGGDKEGGGLGSLLGGGGSSGGGSDGGGGFMGGLKSGLGSGLAQLGVDLLGKGITALSNHLKGGEEGMFVNPARDVYFQQHGGLEGLGSDLTGAVGAERADAMIRALFGADTKYSYEQATSGIDQALADHGGGEGSFVVEAGAIVVNGANRNPDEIADEVVVRLADRWRIDYMGTRTASRGALGVT